MGDIKGRILVGHVVSSNMDRSIVIQVERRVKHPLYKKYITRHTKVMAHDAENACQIGDVVSVRECRPLSKRKRWTLLSIHSKKATGEV